MFGKRIPVSAVIEELHAYCAQNATHTLSRLVELGAHKESLVALSDQKAVFTGLWAQSAYALEAKEGGRKSGKLCQLASDHMTRLDPQHAQLKTVADKLVDASRGAEGRTIDISKRVLVHAFGEDAFDFSKGISALAFELGSCARYSRYLVQNNKIKW